MRDHGGQTDGPFWADGDMMFRVTGTGAEPDRLVKVRRPFAVVGRAPDADILIDDRAASARHAYLHLDPRGVYAVDLVTRTGTRIKGSDQPVGWLRPGDRIEVAGRKIELLRIRIDGDVVEPPPCDADLLAETALPSLTGVTLEPRRPNESPWVLGSELVFLGWSASCGIQVKDAAVARTHCALVRSVRGAYLVDLCGRQTWVEDLAVRGASALHDGDLITLGSTQFTARISRPARSPRAQLPDVVPRQEPAALLARVTPAHETFPALDLPPLSTEIVPAEAQGALLSWIVGAIQSGQGEVLRRQGEFQNALTQILRQMQQDNAALLTAQLDRIESIDRELASLRAEIDRRNGAGGPVRPAPPNVEPLKIARPASTAGDSPTASRASTTWLLDRVNQLEEENRSAWKDLVSRLSQSRKTT
jgi:pSer/pThr/pTyr-binding forkhead associated (FHA) protein